MKTGVCVGTRYNDMLKAKELGYDYVESHCQEIAKADREELDKLKNCGIPILAACCFIGLRVVGKEKDEAAINQYLAEMFEKTHYLGIEYLVFGSSWARKMMPEDNLTADETREQIVTFLKESVVPFCEKYDMTVVIEPLRKEECNVINTVPQAIEIAKKVDSPYVRVLADVKHMVSENDPIENLENYGEYLRHGHTSNPFPPAETGKNRIYPKEGDGFNQDDFFIPMMKAGVEHISIEADVINFEEDAAQAIKVLKKYSGMTL